MDGNSKYSENNLFISQVISETQKEKDWLQIFSICNSDHSYSQGKGRLLVGSRNVNDKFLGDPGRGMMFENDNYDGDIMDYSNFIDAGQLVEEVLPLGISEIGLRKLIHWQKIWQISYQKILYTRQSFTMKLYHGVYQFHVLDTNRKHGLHRCEYIKLNSAETGNGNK
jgi:hypothetical protein